MSSNKDINTGNKFDFKYPRFSKDKLNQLYIPITNVSKMYTLVDS